MVSLLYSSDLPLWVFLDFSTLILVKSPLSPFLCPAKWKIQLYLRLRCGLANFYSNHMVNSIRIWTDFRVLYTFEWIVFTIHGNHMQRNDAFTSSIFWSHHIPMKQCLLRDGMSANRNMDYAQYVMTSNMFLILGFIECLICGRIAMVMRHWSI